ncbi:MAG: hypothetical protein Roseis2KO_54900 [Roseivirga sp.]
MDQDIVKKLEDKLIGRELLGINCYNINDNFFVFEEAGMAIVDGGITLTLTDQSLALGWNEDRELFTMTEGPVVQLFGDSDYYQIEGSNFPFAKELIGQTIQSIKTEWTWYNDLGEYMEPLEPRHYTLHGLVINFNDGQTLQLATVNYDLVAQKLGDFRFCVDGELLLSVNRVVEISSV